ncbi:MAG: lysophospholipid acyltransferase family protein [Polaribacter sp.]|nr:lysophospholipid acyltransferase family protein [Polaribacter sp.]MDG1811129.1 lysophospholipid acyltransferase family protein [Polaribacter sp.]MDG1993448.1 lysophospholipid acyltransferase family protein [Polaribacter sp.]
MKNIWYNFIRSYIKLGLFFYTKKIKVVGKKNIPKKGAVLFAVNHPNGLLDPLLVTTTATRNTHYLVRAAVFKKPLVKKFLATLNLMPIYRIRDGVKELSKNTEVFNDCFKILKKGEALMIFPEGSHDQRRTVRNLSKGFTRIIFGAFEKYPDLKITIIPVGITYQSVSSFPSEVAIHFGKPILANTLYNKDELNSSIQTIKEAVSSQLKDLSVHIPADDNYQTTLKTLNLKNIDFTDVCEANRIIKTNKRTTKRVRINVVKPLYYILIINSIFPWILWKIAAKKIDEREFVDTFRVAIGITLFPVFYLIQAFILYNFYNFKTAVLYLLTTLIVQLMYTKFSTTSITEE